MRALLPIALAGCVDGFQGSNVQFDFSPATPIQASVGAAMAGLGELPTLSHFTLYAFQTGTDSGGQPVGRLFELQQFEIHRIVDLASPCFIDVGAHVPHPGLHVSQYAKVIEADTGISDPANPPAGATEQEKIDVATAITRQGEVALLASDMGLKVVSSASTASYPAVDSGCSESSKIPAPTCIDDASNARRLAMCQAFWKANPDYFEGTDRVLTSPLSGTTHGMVDGMNPINLAPVGGAQFFVGAELDGFDGYAVYTQDDAGAGPGSLLLFGKPTEPTRGVIHVHMTGAVPQLSAELAIFANLDEDTSSF